MYEIDTPFLIIVAEKDNLVKPGHSISMADHLVESKLLIVEAATHASIVRNRKNVDKITKTIFKFFDNNG